VKCLVGLSNSGAGIVNFVSMKPKLREFVTVREHLSSAVGHSGFANRYRPSLKELPR
jgi:hypothetical protein